MWLSMLILGWACYYMPPGVSCYPPSPLRGQPWSPLIHFQEFWPVLSGRLSGKDVVALSRVFPRRGLSGSLGKALGSAVTPLTAHFCAVKPGHGFREEQRWVRQEWQEGCSISSNESGWQRSRSSNIPLQILQVDGGIKTSGITGEE